MVCCLDKHRDNFTFTLTTEILGTLAVPQDYTEKFDQGWTKTL